MTLRPETSSVDIDDLIAGAGGGLPEDVPESGPPQQTAAPKRPQAPVRSPKRVGRPPKVKEEKRNQKVTLSLTDAERSKLKEKSGMVAEATYLLSILREAGVFD